MPTDVLTTLHSQFGFTAFRPGQDEAIDSVLAGQHTLVVMPTGAGKSLVYQLAALHQSGVTLVVSPLIALMKDQVDSLTRKGIAAAYVNSALSGDEQQARLQALADGALRLVYVAPERLRAVRFVQALRRVHVDLLAVDEAHCISEWGHDFRPDYLHIAAARRAMGDPVTVALTATATPQVQDDIIAQLGLPSARRIVTGFNRPNLSFEVRYCTDDAVKLRELHKLLAELDSDAAIIYTGTRREAEEVSEFARAAGAHADYYHAGLSADARTRVQEEFLAGDLPVVVATNAFGMGIDRADVRMVIHYNLPGTLEAYYQEAGRAGRDGDPARALLLYCPKDRALHEWFIENDAPAANELRRLHEAIPAAPQTGAWLSQDDLCLATGLPETKVRVGLAQLEAAGAVDRLGDNGLLMLLRKSAWNEAATRQTESAVEQRRQHRRRQLAAMINYAESNGCRRRLILDHFGDRSPAEADVCCDNCLAAKAAPATGAGGDVAAMSHAERAALIILDTVRRLKWGVGRRKLAQTLTGSRAKAMSAFGYDDNVYFGRLAVFQVREVEDMIGQMVEMGYLKVIGGDQPTLRLTTQGQAALKARSSISLRLPRPVQQQTIANKNALRAAGGTVALTAQMFADGLTPAQIAGERMLTESTIYSHLAELIGQGRIALASVVAAETSALIEEAIGRMGSARALSPLKMALPDGISYGEIRCVAAAWQRDHGQPAAQPTAVQAAPAEDLVADFLSKPHPRPLPGPWDEGWALGFHSGFGGADWKRSPVGDLTYRLKYQSDAGAVQPLVDLAAAICRDHPLLGDVDAIVPIPPSAPRPIEPVSLFTRSLAACLGKPVLPALAKTRQTAPQKEMHSLAQKRANVAGAFAASAGVRGRRLLVIDDLYDSGATLEEATRVLRQAGAARISVLTLTRTIHSDE